MPLYRKKPVVISAVQWFKEGDHPDVKMYFHTPDDNAPAEATPERLELWGEMIEDAFPGIYTLEGFMYVTEGDYIITGVKGEVYPCKPDIFEMTYDYVGELS